MSRSQKEQSSIVETAVRSKKPECAERIASDWLLNWS